MIENKPSFETVYEDQQSKVQRYMEAKTSNPWMAQDLTSNAFLKAYSAWDRFDTSREIPPKNWIMKIAHNEMVNHYRDDKKTVPLEAIPWQVAKDNPADELERKMTAQTIRQAVIKLGEPQSIVIRGLYFEGKKDKELAAELNKSPGAVRVIASRGRQRLKEILKDEVQYLQF